MAKSKEVGLLYEIEKLKRIKKRKIQRLAKYTRSVKEKEKNKCECGSYYCYCGDSKLYWY